VSAAASGISPELLAIIVCPACHADLAVTPVGDDTELVCGGCGLAYPVRDGIPVLLVDEARKPG
jgi:uncharacterized protein YbaR (Trm112 family)